MAEPFMRDFAEAAGRAARDNGKPRNANRYCNPIYRRAWFTGWDVRDNELEQAALDAQQKPRE